MFSLPALDPADYHWIASRIYRNETGGELRQLTYWGEGEDFPSLGIGHFIWFPAGVDAPFDESFPPLLEYLQKNGGVCARPPAWLAAMNPVDAPWHSKQQFDDALDSQQMLELRAWLASTADAQAQYIAASFVHRWNALKLPAEKPASEELPNGNKDVLTALLEQLVGTRQGMFAVIDYYNFKGLGTNTRERYNGEGWGLVQVLRDTVRRQASANAAPRALEDFVQSAASRLTQRVENAPPERKEAKWLPGWLHRVNAYAESPTGAEQREPGTGIDSSVPAIKAAANNGAMPAFRVAPYLTNPSAATIGLRWFSSTGSNATVRVFPAGQGQDAAMVSLSSAATPACELEYDPHELESFGNGQLPAASFRHQLVVDGLAAGSSYRYEVQQDGSIATGTFRVPAASESSLRFIIYGDSETEPESAGKHTPWGVAGDVADSRLYPVDQDSSYRANLATIATRQPDIVAIAGDLVQSGGEQRDWDEFWKLNATLAASVPILAAPGNHDYFGGPGALGKYSEPASRRAISKFKSYFAEARSDADGGDTYFAITRGPARIIFIDGNDGLPPESEHDTNWYLNPDNADSSDFVVPAWTPGSEQHAWLEKTLQSAHEENEFVFVVMHQSAYSSGVHAQPAGFAAGQDPLSGYPLRSLTDLFMRYGVNAVFSGHDELYEHSRLSGQTLAGAAHELHYFVVGNGGDGLRGPAAGVENPYQVFLASRDAPEVVDDEGVLQEGGLHYGHIEVQLDRQSDGGWQARIEPVYLFPRLDRNGQLLAFDRRVYDDVTVLEVTGH